MLKTNAVTCYIDKYPKVLSFCEITPSKSHGNYWQKIPEKIKYTFVMHTKVAASNAIMDMYKCTVYIDEGHGNLLLSLS